jgi:AMMECR1 domain-containing protein
LTAPSPLVFANEAHALWQLQPHKDGVIFAAEVSGQAYRSTFLPQVWAQMQDVQQFMAQLKMKAGLPADFWSDAVQLQTYRVQEFHETPVIPAHAGIHAS